MVRVENREPKVKSQESESKEIPESGQRPKVKVKSKKARVKSWEPWVKSQSREPQVTGLALRAKSREWNERVKYERQ